MDEDLLYSFYLAGFIAGVLLACVIRQACYIERLERRVSYSRVVYPRVHKESHEPAKADSTTE